MKYPNVTTNIVQPEIPNQNKKKYLFPKLPGKTIETFTVLYSVRIFLIDLSFLIESTHLEFTLNPFETMTMNGFVFFLSFAAYVLNCWLMIILKKTPQQPEFIFNYFNH